MIELRTKYEGEGRWRAASHVDWKIAIQECTTGEEMVTRFVRPRSSKENRLFHGAIKAAWNNQRGGPYYPEEEGGWMRLRAWLLCEAGYCDLYEFAPGSISREVVQVLKQRDQDAFWTVMPKTGVIRARFPKSISYKTLCADEFQPIKTRVFEILCNVVVPGTDPIALMEMAHE